ncbi:ABC-2 transporter permease [Staphylococcus simiae]|uniref:ABC-2 transporter permease n=1 Tax=Staphylococcus simiae CCM 7213 = CCUG 51256 TaxID=911238 RepID=G5JHM2_9STAP|nr:ABC-2 transporter permease [Staphylococcus simiae]EHJ08328.1 hypothetical protein SS7213T_04771 [Staphylococcus simiae CCM 7213 = CCUG 51256]PNZ09429.1 ABC-2 transporter permease [Staphylococcus simiae]SNV60151.1 membrane protein [Staphylococcus simiae]
MKGMLLTSFYTTKNKTYIYLLIAILAAAFFSFINPLMSSTMAAIFLITPITDNIKQEKDSRWMYYVSTLPIKRSDYIKAYFVYYLILLIIGAIIGIISTSIVTQSIMMGLMSGLMGFGVLGLYAIVFPLTFKFGPENSNVIMILSSILIVISFLGFFFVYGMVGGSFDNGYDIGMNGILVTLIYSVSGIIIMILSYILSVKIFNQQDL